MEKLIDDGYYIMLRGVGKQRALHQRVTHDVYLVKIANATATVEPTSDLANRLTARRLHHVNFQVEGTTYVSISAPHIPRDHESSSCLAIPLDGDTVSKACESIVRWIATNATTTKASSNDYSLQHHQP